ncbi:zinc finger protein 782-like [Microplitis mediator]|uniref:zinc finger protein 782-like n=1 Tax=Microplitis mediator TaxID=375433 RepID=UPI0025565A54|nr:zinc finger protein 782-like [Microplitis mediator]
MSFKITNNTCRICLLPNKKVENIFSISNYDDYNGLIFEFKQKIEIHCGIEIDKNDGLPSNICIDCIARINGAHDLWKRCQVTDKKLKEFYNRTNGKVINCVTLKNKSSQTGDSSTLEITEHEDEKKLYHTNTLSSLKETIALNKLQNNKKNSTCEVNNSKDTNLNESRTESKLKLRNFKLINLPSDKIIDYKYNNSFKFVNCIFPQKKIIKFESTLKNNNNSCEKKNLESEKIDLTLSDDSENTDVNVDNNSDEQMIVKSNTKTVNNFCTKKKLDSEKIDLTLSDDSENKDGEVENKSDELMAVKSNNNFCKKKKLESQKNELTLNEDSENQNENIENNSDELMTTKSNTKTSNNNFCKKKKLESQKIDLTLNDGSENQNENIENNSDDLMTVKSNAKTTNNNFCKKKKLESQKIDSTLGDDSENQNENIENNSDELMTEKSNPKTIPLRQLKEINDVIENDHCYTSFVKPAIRKSAREKRPVNLDNDESEKVNKKSSESADVKQIQCHLCDKMFVRKSAFLKHIKHHKISSRENKLQCRICNKQLGCNGSLKLHYLTHEEEKPHKCNYCDRRFITKRKCIYHERSHTLERPYTCDLCDANYPQMHLLKLHITKHTGENKYLCDKCGKTFRMYKCLREHLYTHTKEKPFVCRNNCGMAYGNSGSLFAHRKKCLIKLTPVVD